MMITEIVCSYVSWPSRKLFLPGAMGAYMSPAPMGHQMPFEMPMQMYPPAFMGGPWWWHQGSRQMFQDHQENAWKNRENPWTCGKIHDFSGFQDWEKQVLLVKASWFRPKWGVLGLKLLHFQNAFCTSPHQRCFTYIYMYICIPLKIPSVKVVRPRKISGTVPELLQGKPPDTPCRGCFRSMVCRFSKSKAKKGWLNQVVD